MLETSCDFAHALKVLRLASIRGHEEASWLVGKLEGKAPLCKAHKRSWSRQHDWAKSLFIGDESPRALGYAAAFDQNPEVGERSLAWRAAVAGDALGLHFFGKFCMPQTEAIAFFEKAAGKKCALSMYELATHRGKEGDLCAAAVLHIQAAHLGYHRSIEWLNQCYNYSQNRPWQHLDLPLLARAVWWGRSAILFGDFCFSPFDEHLEKLITNTESGLDEAVAVVYAIGRECDSYCDIYRKLPYRNEDLIEPFIHIFKRVNHQCRRAALYCVWGLRRVVHKYVAKMIGLVVYATRSDRVWFRSDLASAATRTERKSRRTELETLAK